MVAFWRGPGFAKVCQGFNFDGKTGVILTIPFFAPSDFWKVPTGSRERVRRHKWRPGKKRARDKIYFGPKGSSKVNFVFFWGGRGG